MHDKALKYAVRTQDGYLTWLEGHPQQRFDAFAASVVGFATNCTIYIFHYSVHLDDYCLKVEIQVMSLLYLDMSPININLRV